MVSPMIGLPLAMTRALQRGATVEVRGSRLVFHREGREIGSTMVDYGQAGYPCVADHAVRRILNEEEP
jgi:hypothetical protein